MASRRGSNTVSTGTAMRHSEEFDHDRLNRDFGPPSVAGADGCPTADVYSIVDRAYFPFAFRHDRSAAPVTTAAAPHLSIAPYPPLIQKHDAVECFVGDLIPKNWKEIESQVNSHRLAIHAHSGQRWLLLAGSRDLTLRFPSAHRRDRVRARCDLQALGNTARRELLRARCPAWTSSVSV